MTMIIWAVDIISLILFLLRSVTAEVFGGKEQEESGKEEVTVRFSQVFFFFFFLTCFIPILFKYIAIQGVIVALLICVSDD